MSGTEHLLLFQINQKALTEILMKGWFLHKQDFLHLQGFIDHCTKRCTHCRFPDLLIRFPQQKGLASPFCKNQ